MWSKQELINKQAEFWDLMGLGSTLTAACDAVGVNRRTGRHWRQATGGRIPRKRREPSGRYLALDERLQIADLRVKWSPEQISLHLAAHFPGRAEMQVCHETIYQALFVQGRGHLRADLHQHLCTGRAVRRPRGSTAKRASKIPDMILIRERRAKVADRTVSGNWRAIWCATRR